MLAAMSSSGRVASKPACWRLESLASGATSKVQQRPSPSSWRCPFGLANVVLDLAWLKLRGDFALDKYAGLQLPVHEPSEAHICLAPVEPRR